MRPKQRYALIACYIATHLLIGFWVWRSCSKIAPLRVYFLDVGQGDCAIIQTPSGKTLLIDAGGVYANRNEDAGARVVTPALRSLGVQSIDALLLTHPDLDHIGGAATLLDRFPITTLLENGRPSQDSLLARIHGIANQKGTALRQAVSGATIDCGDGAKIAILAPTPRPLPNETDNNASIVAQLSYGNHKILFMGDAEEAEESALLQASVSLAADVLKTGHHGSKTSTSEAFLRATKPRFAVVSAGRNNAYGHPHAVTLRRLEAAKTALFRTDQQGAILCETDGTRLKIAPWASR